MSANTRLIKILFVKRHEKKKGVGVGPLKFQNSMQRIFSDSPNFKLIVIDDQAKIRYKLLNHIYEFIQSIRVIHILLDYVYLMTQVILYRKNVDYLIISHYFKYGLFAIFVSFFFKIPFIVPILGWGEKEMSLAGIPKIEMSIQLKYESWVYRKAKYILTSDDLIKGYVKIVKNKDKFLSFYSLIDTNVVKPTPKSEVLINRLGVKNKKVILTVASLVPGKPKAFGLNILIEAFALVKKEYNDVVLLIAGNGRRGKEFEDLIKRLNLKNDVRPLGFCANIIEIVNLSDIFTLIFLFGGGVGFAIMEAMACEKPCVVSRTSGTEFLIDEKEVLLVDLDPKDIADKILLLLNDKKYAQNIGINARKRIESECSIKVGEEKLFNELS
jgi:glycosyltransferase involved in cell wall biosynthesis